MKTPKAERREAPVSRKNVTRQQKGWRVARRSTSPFQAVSRGSPVAHVR
jgi:hypothetical protein